MEFERGLREAAPSLTIEPRQEDITSESSKTPELNLNDLASIKQQ